MGKIELMGRSLEGENQGVLRLAHEFNTDTAVH